MNNGFWTNIVKQSNNKNNNKNNNIIIINNNNTNNLEISVLRGTRTQDPCHHSLVRYLQAIKPNECIYRNQSILLFQRNA